MLSRIEISTRLKAARWLHGAPGERGRPTPLSVAGLVQLEPLRTNRITKNRIEEIEQMKAEARSMELEKIAEALELPHAWFTERDWPTLLVFPSDPPERELERDLDAAGQQSEPSEMHSEGRERASQNP